MSLRENTKHLKEGLKLTAAAGFGATVLGALTLTYQDPESAYLFLDGMMFVVVLITLFAGSLWLLFDIDDWADVDVSEKL